MPFARDTLTQLKQQARANLQAKNPQLLRVSNLAITADTQAEFAHGQLGYLDYISLQGTPFTATDPFTILAWGAIKNLSLNGAQAAVIQIQFTGTPDEDFPAGTQISRNETGDLYTTTLDETVAGSGLVTVTATANFAGAEQTPIVGEAMTLANGVTGIIAGSGVVTDIVTPGADVEDVLNSFKPRMLAAYATPAQGGCALDYIGWASAVPGVTRAWVRPNGNGTGTVVVYVMLDISEAAHGGFPQGSNGVSANDIGPTGTPRDTVATGDQLTVANAICPLQPVTALVYVVSPISTPLNFTISGLSAAGSIVQSNVEAAISSVLLRKSGPFGAMNAAGNIVTAPDLSDIESAIAAVSGTEGFVITSPTTNPTLTTGQMAVLGTVTWT